jgi:hypothetical protein
MILSLPGRLGLYKRIAALIALCNFFVAAFTGQTVADDRFLIRVSVNNNTLVGHPLAWDERTFVLLRRDGSVNSYPIEQVADYSQVNGAFKPYSATHMLERLRAEFGDQYQVTRTENFLVVHPWRTDNRWASTFESMYKQFVHYSEVRGCSIRKPEFALMAIVFKTRKEFEIYSIKNATPINGQIVGYYSLESNRIVTYDQDIKKSKNDIVDNSTVIHEAAHLAAFNTGVHSRFAPPPKWASEGLAVMFEAPGVHFSSKYSDQKDRINRARLYDLKSLIAANKHQGKIEELVNSDDLFMKDPSLAYSLAWGLTFFFAETQSRDYFAYLRDTAGRKPFSAYSSLQRKQEFTRKFGGNFELLEKRLERFVDQLKLQ